MMRTLLATIVCGCLATSAWAEPWAGPGDTRLRNDLQLLNDSGVINVPLTAWPVAWRDIFTGLADARSSDLAPDVLAAYARVRELARYELTNKSAAIELVVAGATNPRVVRSFENTPREDGEATAGLSWIGERFAFNLRASYADNPFDGDEFHPDGSYIGMALGNWMLSAGWQERWWGPGRDGSMILSTNARPMPSVGIQRSSSMPSGSKWFRWMGPWTLTTFMGHFDDDERVVEDGLLWGFRASFRPLRGLEIGLSRSAQWCGDGRKCDLKTFLRLLNGNDNRGANVDPEDEPGNQLAGFDVRWTLPSEIPLAIYIQWTAEDTRRTGAQLHQWMEQVGVEYWGTIGGLSHRTHFEIADSAARLGSLGEGSHVPNSAYNHSIFQTGYRYNGRALGHSMDGDGLSFSLGSTLVQSAGHTWNFSLRHMEINRMGDPDSHHTLSATPQELFDIQISHERMFKFGRIDAGIGYSRLDDDLRGTKSSDVNGFLRWRSR